MSTPRSILVKNGIVLTVDPANTVISDGAVLIEGDRIEGVGPSAELVTGHEADVTIDADGSLVIPGLVNAHTHGLFYLTRGLGMDGSLLDWLKGYVGPFFMHMSEQDAYYGALLSFLENLRMGNTLVVDNFYAPGDRKHNADQVARAAEQVGIRAVLARCYVDQPGRAPPGFVEDTDDVVQEYERLVQTWHEQAQGRLQVWVAPITLPSCTTESLLRLGEFAGHHGIGMHTHCAETQESVEMVERLHGRSFVEVFDELGILGPGFHAVHSVWLSDRELQLLRDSEAKVVHNPVANMLLAEGIAPIAEMQKLGITVALGTDAPNNRQDMMQVMKFAVLLQRVARLDVGVLSASDVLRMATIDGALALGMEDEMGSLEVGKKADLVIVDVLGLHTVPLHDPVAALVYSATGSDVDTVIVDGRVLVRHGELVSWDEQDLIDQVQARGLGLRERALAAA
jgi:5-methylthioadenosine/S-adenosylhomocysteine deaminase